MNAQEEKDARMGPGKRQIARRDFAMAKTGRKSPLMDEAKIERLVDALLAGNTIKNSCAMGGIGESTFYRWMADSETAEEGSPLREFRERIKRAQAEAEHRNVITIQKAAAKSWQAAAWWLERRYPADYALRNRIAVGGDTDAPPIATAAVGEKTMSDADALAALQAVLQRAQDRRLNRDARGVQRNGDA